MASTSQTVYGDIGGLIEYQKNYLSGLLKMFDSPASVLTPTQKENAIAINSSVNTLSNDLSFNVAPAILEKQQEMNKIITDETNRLKQKENSINELTDSKKRLIQLNTNFIERKEQYKKMVIAVVIGLAVYLAVYFIGTYVPLPETLVTFILVVTITVIIIYCLRIFAVMNNRDKMDYEQVSFIPPVTMTPAEISSQLGKNKTAAMTGGNLLSALDLGLCVGSSCCSADTVWDAETQKCKDATPPAQSSFTTMGNAETSAFKENGLISGNTGYFAPSEYDGYSPYR
jgi:ABC-type multidrug transport system fused ATPase/permease subunit